MNDFSGLIKGFPDDFLRKTWECGNKHLSVRPHIIRNGGEATICLIKQDVRLLEATNKRSWHWNSWFQLMKYKLRKENCWCYEQQFSLFVKAESIVQNVSSSPDIPVGTTIQCWSPEPRDEPPSCFSCSDTSQMDASENVRFMHKTSKMSSAPVRAWPIKRPHFLFLPGLWSFFWWLELWRLLFLQPSLGRASGVESGGPSAVLLLLWG